jgi:hypothetical protein
MVAHPFQLIGMNEKPIQRRNQGELSSIAARYRRVPSVRNGWKADIRVLANSLSYSTPHVIHAGG